MCDSSGKLIAWIDRELPEREAAEVERHLPACGECRERLAAFRQASSAFDAYCEAIFAAETQRQLPRWAIVACGAGAIAAAAAIFALVMLPRRQVAHVPVRPTPAATAPYMAAQPLQGPPAPADVVRPPHTGERPASRAFAPVRRSLRQFAVDATENSRKVERGTISGTPMQSSPTRDRSPFPPEPPIEIAIPAEAMFPPGAVPPGMSFTGDLAITADGSAQWVGLRPRLAGFERRTDQP